MDSDKEFVIRSLNEKSNPEKTREFSKGIFIKNFNRIASLAEKYFFRSNALRISVVGSNGKGSLSFYLSYLFSEILSSVSEIGLYTSPHLLEPNERIRINQTPVSYAKIKDAVCFLKNEFPADYESLSYFELLTLAAMYIFRKEKTGIEIYEAGLGGRWDAVKTANADIIVLTSVSKEHTALLGDTLEKILIEKLNIITERTKLFFWMPHPVLGARIPEEALKINPNLKLTYPPSEKLEKNTSYLERNFVFAEYIIKRISEFIEGEPEKTNLIPKNKIIKRRKRKSRISLSVPGQSNGIIPKTVRQYSIPGRMEIRRLKTNKPIPIIFDTAHNKEALEFFLESIPFLLKQFVPENCIVYFSLLKDKNPAEFYNILKKANFNGIYQITGADFAEAVNSEFSLHKDNFFSHLQKTAQVENIKFIILLGTHRIYSLFDRITKKVK